MKITHLYAGAAALALCAAPAAAQDHSGHPEDMATKKLPTPVPDQQLPVEPERAASMPDHTMMGHAMPGMEMSDMDMAKMAGEGSGTSLLPANEQMAHGLHIPVSGDTTLMLHGFVWPVYSKQSGPRGDDKLYVQSMAMATLTAPFAGGKFTARTMMSLEPLMRHDGYPNLFATGEVAYGEPLVDRQHPHDLFMELSARLDLDVAPDTSVFLYGGPVAEPALGPSAFMHRATAKYNPEAPITHHWFDSTHITYGVVTGGVKHKNWQLESSAFRGREPDEFRWNIETPKLDSWSVRGSFAPSPAWLVQASYGQIKEPEAMHPGEDEYRTTASVHYNNGSGLSAMGAFSSKNRQPGDVLTAWLGEVN